MAFYELFVQLRFHKSSLSVLYIRKSARSLLYSRVHSMYYLRNGMSVDLYVQIW